jgi:hypothetical protein
MHHANGRTYRNVLHCVFHELLCEEAKERDKRSIDEWPRLEREAMWKMVNEERANRSKEALPVEDVQRVEQMALGHTDYGTKYALYCTELVEDRP